MHKAKLRIKRTSNTYKLYVYRSKNVNDIDTIEKVRKLTPVIEIDESMATGDYYEIIDSPHATMPHGITYNGPAPEIVQCHEYENIVEVKQYNRYTYYNTMELKPLELKYNGVMFYYSILGVNEQLNTITHLSKVSGVLIETDDTQAMRHIYACDDTEADEPIWYQVSSAEASDRIIIGDIKDNPTYDKYGVPFVETVRPIERFNAVTRDISTRNLMVLEIQNPWQNNNIDFNYRKLKSYKVQNVINDMYSKFSEPTFQSLLPVSIEKVMIFISEKDTLFTPDNYDEEKCDIYQIIRRDGLFYDPIKHKALGLNKYNIPLGEKLAVFNEASKQSDIKIQIPAKYNRTYYITIYVMDIYMRYSEAKREEVIT